MCGDTMKKVLFTATVVKTHIMEFHIPYLKMLQDMGWETAVASRNDYFEDPTELDIPYCDQYFDIPFRRFPLHPMNIKAFFRLKKVIDQGNYDIIHCHTPVGAMITRLAAGAARKQGTKVIYTAHGFHFFKGAPLLNWLIYYPVEWCLAHMTDVLVTINKEDYTFAQKKIHAKRIEYVPGMGIDISRFHAGRSSRLEKRQELGLKDEDFLILTVAEMTKNKNHSTIVKAMALLKDKPEYENMYYLICGRGEEKDALAQEAQQLGVADRVIFLGYRHDVPELCRCSDMFAFMSFREGLPVALMEAMSCGLPAICSEIRGNTDLIDDGEDGVFVENTPQAVAEGILAMYRDPELRARLGSAAEAKIRMFDAKSVHERMKEIYLSV